jgi:hypothetical protein
MDVYFSADHQVKITQHEMRNHLDHLLSKELLTCMIALQFTR